MSEEKKNLIAEELNENSQESKTALSETWAQDALEDLEDWIEEQGIYIRQ